MCVVRVVFECVCGCLLARALRVGVVCCIVCVLRCWAVVCLYVSVVVLCAWFGLWLVLVWCARVRVRFGLRGLRCVLACVCARARLLALLAFVVVVCVCVRARARVCERWRWRLSSVGVVARARVCVCVFRGCIVGRGRDICIHIYIYI